MEKIKLKYEDVTYEMAVPARKREVVLWLLTGGKKGRLFARRNKEFIKFMSAESNINCRCSTVKI